MTCRLHSPAAWKASSIIHGKRFIVLIPIILEVLTHDTHVRFGCQKEEGRHDKPWRRTIRGQQCIRRGISWINNGKTGLFCEQNKPVLPLLIHDIPLQTLLTPINPGFIKQTSIEINQITNSCCIQYITSNKKAWIGEFISEFKCTCNHCKHGFERLSIQ